jgi:NAD(P)H-hydrate epimerase
MKIFDTKDIRDIDAYTIKNEPVSSIDLMERAANGCAQWIAEYFTANTHFTIFTGPGNNGGDGWAIARILYKKGFHNIELYHLQISQIISRDAEINRDRLIGLSAIPVHGIEDIKDFPILNRETVIIDALYGSGLNRSLEGLPANLVQHINRSECRIISVDVPSGLFGEDNTGNAAQSIIHATENITFEFPKRSFFFAENEKYTGRWHIIPIGLHKKIITETPSSFYYTTIKNISSRLKKRSIFSHKGIHGHGLLIAGSYGMMGAAILGARACIRTGAGLVTTHVPRSGYPIVQTAVPESIFSIDIHETHFATCPELTGYSAAGIGPGTGKEKDSVNGLEQLLKTSKIPLILDADALNILSENPLMMDLIPRNTILTPHPGEFDRLAGSSGNGYQRNQLQIELSKRHQIIIVLKGAFSSITLPDGKCFYNSTGNPGMATAGAGDVLTGMILSLLAQRYPPDEAAVLGTFLHGLAGDIAARDLSEQSLIASDIIENIGNAFNKILNYEMSAIS